VERGPNRGVGSIIEMILRSILILYVLVTVRSLLFFNVPSNGGKLAKSPVTGRGLLHTELAVAAGESGEVAERGSREGGSDRDLAGNNLWISFTGFGVVDMNFAIELKENFKAVYSRGLESREPGFWRVVRYDDGKETVEITQPLLPEYLYFFDIWEASILWRGELNMATGRVENGEVITNKKRFGLFPYTEVLATFSADLMGPESRLPDVVVPELNDQNFVMPVDFNVPGDMKKYPDLFNKDYVDWMFQVEDATVRGETPPPRPRAFFVPNADGGGEEEGSRSGFVGAGIAKEGGSFAGGNASGPGAGSRGSKDQVGGKLRKRKR